MAAWAAEDALRNAGLDKNQLDLIIFASAAQEQAVPDTALSSRKNLDLETLESPLFSSLNLFQAFSLHWISRPVSLSLSAMKPSWIVCCELSFTSINEADPSTYTLFGDAAAAAILGPTPQGIARFRRPIFFLSGDIIGSLRSRAVAPGSTPMTQALALRTTRFRQKGRELLRYTSKCPSGVG